MMSCPKVSEPAFAGFWNLGAEGIVWGGGRKSQPPEGLVKKDTLNCPPTNPSPQISNDHEDRSVNSGCRLQVPEGAIQILFSKNCGSASIQNQSAKTWK